MYFICILLLIVQIFLLLFVIYLIGCKIGFVGPKNGTAVPSWSCSKAVHKPYDINHC